MNFDEKLQMLRKKQNITQEELAEKLNVSRQAVSKWEAGQTMPEVDKIIELARMYDISLDYILTDNEKDDIEKKKIGSPKDNVEPKQTNGRIITGSVFLGLGLIGILLFYFFYILNPVKVNGRDLDFNRFLIYYKSWPLIIFCSILIFMGLLMLIKNTIIGAIKAYSRQSLILKSGIIVFPFGIIALILSQVLVFTQTVVIAGNSIRGQSFNPFILLIFSLMITILGLGMLIVGVIKKMKNK